jgi:hypothetical protein
MAPVAVEDILTNVPEVDPGIGSEAFRHAPQGGPLHLAIFAIRKGGHHGDRENGFLFGGCHMGGKHCHLNPSCSHYDPAWRFQPPVEGAAKLYANIEYAPLAVVGSFAVAAVYDRRPRGLGGHRPPLQFLEHGHYPIRRRSFRWHVI